MQISSSKSRKAGEPLSALILSRISFLSTRSAFSAVSSWTICNFSCCSWICHFCCWDTSKALETHKTLAISSKMRKHHRQRLKPTVDRTSKTMNPSAACHGKMVTHQSAGYLLIRFLLFSFSRSLSCSASLSCVCNCRKPQDKAQKMSLHSAAGSCDQVCSTCTMTALFMWRLSFLD